MTIKEAFKLDYDFWIWLSENPECGAKDFPKYNDLSMSRMMESKYIKYWIEFAEENLYKKWKDGKGENRILAAKKTAAVKKGFMIQEGLWDE